MNLTEEAADRQAKRVVAGLEAAGLLAGETYVVVPKPEFPECWYCKIAGEKVTRHDPRLACPAYVNERWRTDDQTVTSPEREGTNG